MAIAVRSVPPEGALSRTLLFDSIATWTLRAAAGFAVVLVLLVVLFLAANALPLFRHTTPGDLAGTTWEPDAGLGFDSATPSFGILAPLLGSVAVVGLTLLFAVPLSLCLALTLEETAPRAATVFRPLVDILAGIPSVVFGYIGLTVLVPALRGWAPPGRDGSGVLAAAVVLTFMVVPTITALSADAIRAVPVSLREASHALGATPWETIRRVVLPAARNGVITGCVLGFARGMGEALAVSLVIGDVNQIPGVSQYGARWFLAPFTTLTVTITDGVDKLAINPAGTAARYLLALLLLAVTFGCVVAVRALQRRGEMR